MNTTKRAEQGETLVEILIAIFIIFVVVTAYFATFTTQGAGSTAQRSLVTADAVLRSYAEATKSAVREQCVSGSTYSVSFTEVAGFPVNPLNGQPCPPRQSAATWSSVTLQVTMPNSKTRSLSVVVRAP
jgi:hypothetical protein